MGSTTVCFFALDITSRESHNCLWLSLPFWNFLLHRLELPGEYQSSRFSVGVLFLLEPDTLMACVQHDISQWFLCIYLPLPAGCCTL